MIKFLYISDFTAKSLKISIVVKSRHTNYSEAINSGKLYNELKEKSGKFQKMYSEEKNFSETRI